MLMAACGGRKVSSLGAGHGVKLTRVDNRNEKYEWHQYP